MNRGKGGFRFISGLFLSFTMVLNILTLPGVSPGAEKFPSKEIIIVVQWTAGGPVDLPARTLAEYLKKDIGVPVTVENRTGG